MKGISPLLASILLIAITVTVASIVSGWTTSTFSSSQNEVSNRTASALSCSSSAITINNVFIGAGNNGTASVIVQNSGNVDNLAVTSGQLYDRLGNNFSANNTLTLNVGQMGTLTFKMPHNTNGTADSSLRINNGICYGMSAGNQTCAYLLSGKKGGAMSFDGVDDYVRVPTSSALNIVREITVAAWLKANKHVTWHRVVQKFDASLSVPPYAISLGGGDALFGWGCEFADASTYIQIFDKEAQPGIWYYVACTGSKSGNSTMLYVDGTVKNSSSWIPSNGDLLVSALDLNIGKLRDAASGYYNGTIDEVQVWNRSLGGNEINDSMNMGAFAVPNTNDLVGYWKFDDGKGVLSCPSDFSSVRVTTQCADAQGVYTARPQC